jgi:hypothetical protein
MTLLERAGLGAVAGAAATVPMSLVMLAAGRAGLMGEQPPRRLTANALRAATDAPPREPTRTLASAALHVAFGAAVGAGFAAAVRRATERAPATAGVVAGLTVWAASYAGWIPALGLLPPPWRDRPGRPGSMIAAHVVFGACLGRGLAWLVGRRRGDLRALEAVG